MDIEPFNTIWIEPSDTLAYATGSKYHHLTMIMLGGNVGRLDRYAYIVHFPTCRDLIFSAVGVVPHRYVCVRAVFTISNSTSFIYRSNFSLKLLVHHSENMSPLSFLSVPVSEFL